MDESKRPNVEWRKKQVYTEWQCLYEVKKQTKKKPTKI